MERSSLRSIVSRQSSMAPGLPNRPLLPTNRRSKTIPILSINYDYIPTALESPKNLWVDLEGPAPWDLGVGTICKLHLSPYRTISTELQRNSRYNSMFQVDDIIGTRVVLLPYRGSSWLPTLHSSCDNPFGWGYDMQRINVGPNMHSRKYGYGSALSFLEYFV